MLHSKRQEINKRKDIKIKNKRNSTSSKTKKNKKYKGLNIWLLNVANIRMRERCSIALGGLEFQNSMLEQCSTCMRAVRQQ